MIIRQEDLGRLYAAMDTVPEMRGAGVVYLDGMSTNMLRASGHVTGLDTYLVIQEIDLAPCEVMAPPKPYKQTNADMVASELIGAGLNCGAMVLLGIASAGTAVCTVGTAGGCAPLLGLTALGVAATGAQCGISIGRVIIAVADPKSIGLTNLDSQTWYQGVSIGLEVASFAGTLGSAAGSANRWRALKDARSGEQIQFLMNASSGEKAVYGADIATYMRIAAQDARNAITLRWMRSGRAAAIFTDATRSLKVNQLQAFMDIVSNIMGVYSNVRSDAVAPAIGPMLQRGLQMVLIQNQDAAPRHPDPPGYLYYASLDVDPVPGTDYSNPFNLPF
ncbi:hypothetical protein [Bradyrhizobium jicamae]|uniref:hypothetical protein n=1 Tax=Bradyrhizobium jicamae TaxID=280332 RepID=UPI001BA46B59|nr:hypothetical protein [Bradyrhizobium jicamae]MBR0937310.1 hypothetical protein [Bradyrhizobium jicamae]